MTTKWTFSFSVAKFSKHNLWWLLKRCWELSLENFHSIQTHAARASTTATKGAGGGGGCAWRNQKRYCSKQHTVQVPFITPCKWRLCSSINRVHAGLSGWVMRKTMVTPVFSYRVHTEASYSPFVRQWFFQFAISLKCWDILGFSLVSSNLH